MERLAFEGNFCDICRCDGEYRMTSECADGACSQRKVWERLKAYEDTGLEPCDYNAMKAALEQCEEAKKQLTELICIVGGVGFNRLRELTQAENDRRIMVLPCEIGGMVWTNISIQGDKYKKTDRLYPVKVVYFGIREESAYLHVAYSNGLTFPFNFDEIGKTVFLTCDEAEKAIEDR